MTTIDFADSESQVSGFYQADRDGDLEEWVLLRLDQAFREQKPLRLAFDDWTNHYERGMKAARPHILAKGYHKTYQYWYDGCNHSGEDYIKGRPIPESGGALPPYSPWASHFWSFEDTEGSTAAPVASTPYLASTPSLAQRRANLKARQRWLEQQRQAEQRWLERLRQEELRMKKRLQQEELRMKMRGEAVATPPPPEPDMCMVCLSSHAETLVMPCGHSVACRECSQGLAETVNAHLCIVCRTPIERILMDGMDGHDTGAGFGGWSPESTPPSSPR